MLDQSNIKSFLVYGSHIKELRAKYHIGFMEFCRRSGLSTRTLASIEGASSKIILDETMTKIMRGFNLTRQGLRRKLLPVEKVAEGSFSIRNPIISSQDATYAKITIYLNKSLHGGLQAYAQKYGCSKNKAVAEVLRKQFHLVENGVQSEKYTSTFETMRMGSL